MMNQVYILILLCSTVWSYRSLHPHVLITNFLRLRSGNNLDAFEKVGSFRFFLPPQTSSTASKAQPIGIDESLQHVLVNENMSAIVSGDYDVGYQEPDDSNHSVHSSEDHFANEEEGPVRDASTTDLLYSYHESDNFGDFDEEIRRYLRTGTMREFSQRSYAKELCANFCNKWAPRDKKRSKVLSFIRDLFRVSLLRSYD